MFFRRMFQRKDAEDKNSNIHSNAEDVNDQTVYYTEASKYGNKSSQRVHLTQGEFPVHRSDLVASSPRVQRKFGSGRKPSSAAGALHCAANSSSGVAFVQLTPLWEHLLRTRTLPDSICPQQMFAEFLERLRDPEWQVRQHALRVFVDVLVVMGAKADSFMEPLVEQLVENLGHQAPTVRKGALDCLRVYLTETAMPETIMLQILDIGLNQKITKEPFGGRLTCGVMLSLPALLQSTLHTNKRHFILRSCLEMLVLKLGQVTHQEITLKVLAKIRELIGEQEFVALLTNSAYHEFELLCNVYGLQHLPPTSTSAAGHLLQRDEGTYRTTPHFKAERQADNGWGSPDEDHVPTRFPGDKVILETEIKINDETLTMRILEAKDTDAEATDSTCVEESPRKDGGGGVGTYLNSLEDEVICGRMDSIDSDSLGVIRLLSDSELEEICHNRSPPATGVGIVTPTRTAKRVTFGGEIVKMRTPDSDANNNNEKNSEGSAHSFSIEACDNRAKAAGKVQNDVTNPLSLEILNDNTKPLPHPDETQAMKFDKAASEDRTTTSSPAARRKDSTTSLSPRSPFKRMSISPVDSIISPKVPHKEIEVLHNLQRDPSPVRARRASTRPTEDTCGGNEETQEARSLAEKAATTPPPPSSWEDLGIVDEDVLMDLRAGDWRCRWHGLHSLQAALQSSDNLARVQPCLDTLLRLLLSSERHPEVAESKRRLLINLIARLPLDNLEQRTLQIMTGLCRQGGAGAHRACKALMQRLPPAAIVLKLLSDEFLHAKSSRFREHALQMVMYALVTFPSTCIDVTTSVTNATFAALDRKKRVRQAALEVLAVLGQSASASPGAVFDVVQTIAATRDEGAALLAAVKARLARKQLPLVTEDGTVQYTVRVSSHKQQPPLEASADRSILESGKVARMGADVDWIIGGVGSVSPTSLKRHAQRHRSSSQQSLSRFPDHCHVLQTAAGRYDKTCSKLHNSTRSSLDVLLAKEGGLEKPQKPDDTQPHNVQYAFGGSGAPLHFGIASKRCNVDFNNYVNRRLVAKACSDSSMDGRSSDSTFTSSSSGGGGGGGVVGSAVPPFGCAASNEGITGRYTRQQTLNSRFPAMDRLDMTYVRAQKQPAGYAGMGMGAYAQLQQQQYNLNAPQNQPKINYGIANSKRRQPMLQQQQQQRLCFNSQENFKQQEIHMNERKNNKNDNSITSSNNNNVHGSNNINKCNNQCHCSNCNASDNNNSATNAHNLDVTYTIPSNSSSSSGADPNTLQHQNKIANGGNSSSRRFINVEKFIKQSNKYSQTNASTEEIPTPVAQQSQPPIQSAETTSSYSLKSTASAQSVKSSFSAEEILIEDEVEVSLVPAEEAAVVEANQEQERSVEVRTPTERSESSPNMFEESTEGVEPLAENLDENQCSTPTTSLSGRVDIEATNNEVNDESPIVLHLEERLDETAEVLLHSECSRPLATEEEFIESSSIGSAKSQRNKAEVQAQSRPTTPLSKQSAASSGCRSATPGDVKSSNSNLIAKKPSEATFHLTEQPSPMRKEPLDNSTETSSSTSSSSSSSHGQINHRQNSCAPNIRQPQRSLLPRKKLVKNNERRSPEQKSVKGRQASREALNKINAQLDSPLWETNILGLKALMSLIHHRPNFLDRHMHCVCLQLSKSVRNLRSQVSRLACQAAAELFGIRSRMLEQECDCLANGLLNRTADTNRFLRADAMRALEVMCSNLTPAKVMHLLGTKGAVHQHALVRTTSAKLLNRLVERLGCDKIYSMPPEQRDKFFVAGANYLLEGSMETRDSAKALFKQLCNHPNYIRVVVEAIPLTTYRNVEKTLRNIRQGSSSMTI